MEVGQTVTNGQIIAESGATGGVTGPHLHFEILENGIQVNPMTIYDLQAFLNLPIDFGTLEEVIIIQPPVKKENSTTDEPSNPDAKDNENTNNQKKVEEVDETKKSKENENN